MLSATSRRIISDTRGANLIEYVILVGLVAIVSIVGYRLFGETLKKKVYEEGAAVHFIGK